MNHDAMRAGDSQFSRIMRTPLRRLLRGRLGPGQTVEDVVASLPADAAATVREVVRRSRLWRTEKLSVAEELAAHFHDGLEAGVPEADLVRDFGDTATAAKLIRRAKKRNRPMLWQIGRWAFRGVVAVILLYIGLGIYYLMGEAQPTVDYRAQLLAPLKAVPQDEQGWPLYREALLRFGKLPDPAGEGLRLDEMFVGDAGWPQIEAYLLEHHDALTLVRRGAAKSGLGFVPGEFDEADAALGPHYLPPQKDGGLWDESLVGLLLPQLSSMRELSLLLILDTRRAAAEGDGKMVVANVAAMLGLAKHSAETRILIADMVALAILREAVAEVRQTLASDSQLLTEDQLTALAHAFAGADSVLVLDFSGERMMFLDVMQRTFTPGDEGHLTLDGLESMQQIGPVDRHRVDLEQVAMTAGYPAVALAVGSRVQIIREYDRRIMGTYQLRVARPMWEWSGADGVDRLDDMTLTEQIRYAPVMLLLPALHRIGEAVTWARTERDATQVALALELHRRRHGAYPDSLKQLVPSVLPEVPLDPFTGMPMQYRVVNDLALLYCVGVDRDDDGGRAVPHPANRQDPTRQWIAVEQLPHPSDTQRYQAIDGDWILYDAASGAGRAPK